MRERNVAALEGGEFDLAIAGGGIFGAGAAREAALQGWRVALLEKGDFASGTSSQSSKLVHGGLRYLERFHLRLVKEALGERHVLHRLAPHLVHPLPFLIPIYRDSARGRLKTRIGLWLYDRLASKVTDLRHEMLSRDAILEREPLLSPDGLVGGASFFDFQTDDARLTLACVLSATDRGAVALNYCPVVRVAKAGGAGWTLTARDLETGREIAFRARAILDTTGPWLPEFRGRLVAAAARSGVETRLTKGVHVTHPRLTRHALLLMAKSDGRVFFCLPWKGVSLIGTTDTDHQGPPETARVTGEDVTYLLTEAGRAFRKTLSEADVIGRMVGLRTLVRSKTARPSDNPREHVVFEEPHGVVHVAGGKLTTFRRIARAALERIAAGTGLPLDDGTLSATTPLVGAPAAAASPESAAVPPVGSAIGPASDRERIAERYGSRAAPILDAIARDPRLASPLAPWVPETLAELEHSVRNEFVLRTTDFIRRRTARSLLSRIPDADLRAVVDALGALLGWPAARREQDVRETREAEAAGH